MARSAALRTRDLRAIYDLVGECRELGDDAPRWREHLTAGLGRMTGAGLAIVGELPIGPVPPRRVTGEATWGWGNGFDRAA